MDLTGTWIGRYAPAGRGRVTPFEVELLPAPDGFSGLMVEPDGGAESLRSRLDGSGAGTRVRFRKCWLDVDPGDDALHSGLLSADGLRIVGRWWFPLTGRANGLFSMARVPVTGARRGAARHRARG